MTPTIVALAGAGEYAPEVTLPPVARRIADAVGARLEFRASDIAEDVPDFPVSTFGGLDVLAEADLLVLALRFRHLDPEELAAVRDYVERGGAILALRTSNHAFRPGGDSALDRWATEFPDRYLGSAWSTHHGHTSTTRVTAVGDSPLLAGVPASFTVDSWLYATDPPSDATVLLHGDPIAPEIAPLPSPVAWTRELGTQRIFYTSLGSESDLERPEVLTLLENAARWCLGRDDR
jgi:type 1 glutamine amidotransferase